MRTCMRASRALCSVLVVAATLVLARPAEADIDCRPLRSRYEAQDLFLQHNLRFEDDEASWVNFVLTGDYLPLGTPVRVHKVKEDEVVLSVAGRDGKLSLDVGDGQPSCRVLLERLLGEQPPDLTGLTEPDLNGIKRAVLLVGMSRRAVFFAVGYPPHYYSPPFAGDKSAVNHDPAAEVLTYMGSKWDFIPVTFKDDVLVAVGD